MQLYSDSGSTEAFDKARFLSLLGDLKSLFTREDNRLLSFDSFSRKLNLKNQRYLGIKAVPTRAIVGSVDRYLDFDRRFLPRKAHLETRWSNIYKAYSRFENLPLVKLYKVGELYFVVDGNHRVSVAKNIGTEFIDAEVIEFLTKFPVTRQMDPKDLFILTERENFLQLTGLVESRPQIKIRLTIPGKYEVLLDQIGQFREAFNLKQNSKLDFKQAAALWYDQVYEPALEKIEESHIVDRFGQRTKSDLLVWIYEHQQHLRKKYGQDIQWSQAMDHLSGKYGNNLWGKARAFWIKLFSKRPAGDNGNGQ